MIDYIPETDDDRNDVLGYASVQAPSEMKRFPNADGAKEEDGEGVNTRERMCILAIYCTYNGNNVVQQVPVPVLKTTELS
jgi:hypothetical protein